MEKLKSATIINNYSSKRLKNPLIGTLRYGQVLRYYYFSLVEGMRWRTVRYGAAGIFSTGPQAIFEGGQAGELLMTVWPKPWAQKLLAF